ncbi:MAG: Yip1 family protein [Ignavibacteriaceae bacterium]
MNLVDRAKNIIVSPKTEWDVVAGEEPNIQQIIVGYVIPLALIPAIAVILGWGLFGVLGYKSFTYGIALGLVQLLNAIIGVFLAAFVIDALATSFGSQKNLGRAVQLVAFSMTPAWLGGILSIFPAIGCYCFNNCCDYCLLCFSSNTYCNYVCYLWSECFIWCQVLKDILFKTEMLAG